jgi:hypothetical protein
MYLRCVYTPTVFENRIVTQYDCTPSTSYFEGYRSATLRPSAL